jgi:dTDP-4-dehydrorhamnose reductase
VTEGHLFKYLGDERSGCPTSRQEVAQLLIAATDGDFGQVVALIDLAQKGSWYDLLGKLRREQGAEQPVDDELL